MAEIKTRPATPEYRENWDRIFRRSPRMPESIEEIDRLMADVGVGGRVTVLDASGGKLAFTVTEDDHYNRKLVNALFKCAHHYV